VVGSNFNGGLVGVNVNITSGYTAVTAGDKSDVHVVGGLLHRPEAGSVNGTTPSGGGNAAAFAPSSSLLLLSMHNEFRCR
jgi:hypothetical protein